MNAKEVVIEEQMNGVNMLAQIGDISKAIEEHIELFGGVEQLEGALTMAVSIALRKKGITREDGKTKSGLVNLTIF